MLRRPAPRPSFAAALLALLAAAPAAAEVELAATWQPPDYAAVRALVLEWSADAPPAAEQAAARVAELWPREAPADAAPDALADRVARTAAIHYPEAAELVRRCDAPYAAPAPVDAPWLVEAGAADFIRHNMRLHYGRWLAQHGLYDEALEHLAELEPADVVDPASLLFYQMVAYHQLVRPEEARAALARLQERADQLPRRYGQVAELVERDLAALDDESLDHIARRMRDVRRRLDHGRAGEAVQRVERGVLESLDKLIDEAEKQQQQQQAAAAAGGSSKSAKPMEDSRPAELKAPMQVDRRDIGDKAGWGELPPKEREQALQQIGREFPAHYRELIENYFRELADEPAPESK